MDVTEVNAEPSTATQFDATNQYTWTSEQRERWNKTGEIPKPKQESAPADKPEKTVAPDDAAEPGTAKRQEPTKRDKVTAEERKAQLNREIQDLVARRNAMKAEVESRDVKPEPKAEPSPAKATDADEPKEPALSDFKDYDEYEKSHRKWVRDFAKWSAEQAIQRFRQEQTQAEQQRQFQQQFEEGKKRYADFEEKVRPAAKALWENQQIIAPVKVAIGNSELALDLMYVLGGDEAQFNQFLETAKTDPVKAIKYIGKVEDLIRAEQSKAKAAPEKKEAPVQPQPRAPKPPSEVGGRGSAAEDGLVAAARANDFRAFEAEQTRRVMASRK